MALRLNMNMMEISKHFIEYCTTLFYFRENALFKADFVTKNSE